MNQMRFVLSLLLLITFSAPIFGAEVHLQVADAKGKPVENAVLTLQPKGPPPALTPPEGVAIEQRDREYLPLVTVVPIGTKITFPNQDTVQHHVYSFSAPKKFDLPLYKESAPEPVLFDKPGVVVLGCNIHDWMKAYVVVTETPFYSRSDATGALTISGLPAGEYVPTLWHPRLRKVKGEPLPAILVLGATDKKDLKATVELKRESRPQKRDLAPSDY